jgi:hypothetical protein
MRFIAVAATFAERVGLHRQPPKEHKTVATMLVNINAGEKRCAIFPSQIRAKDGRQMMTPLSCVMTLSS